MLQDALTFRAQRAAITAWAANQTAPGCDNPSPGVDRSGCVLSAEQLPLETDLFCLRLKSATDRLPSNFARALAYCDELDIYKKQVVDNVYDQAEYAGVPYSWGGVGQGVRLVLGSDVTGTAPNVSGVPVRTRTEW